MSRWPIILLVLCAAALGLAACGGGDDGGGDGDSVDKILSETFGKGKEVKSGRLDLSLQLDAKGVAQLQGPVKVGLTGPFQSQGAKELPKFDFEAAIDAGGQQLKAGAVSTGEKGFLTFQGQPYVLSDALFKQFKDGYAQQAECTEEQGDGGGSFSALGANPRDWLRDAKKAGEEKVGGAETTQISGTVDVAKLLEDVNRVLARTDPQQSSDPCAEQTGDKSEQQGARTLTAEQRKQLTDAVKSARVDIWTGKEDRTMRRMNVEVRFDVPKGAQQSAGGMTSGTLKFDLTIGALNEDQTIAEPKNAKPFEELMGQLQGATGGATGSSGSGGGSANGATPSAGSKYQQCLQEAGADVAKMQQCQDLVGQ